MAHDRTFRIPTSLRETFAATADGSQWLGTLPRLVDDVELRWEIRTGSPFEGGVASWCAPAMRADGTEVVVKVGFPHREAREEGTALRFWDGDGAARLVDDDRDHLALLIERCRPGTTLRDAGLPAETALHIGAELLRRLWREPPDPSRYERVADVTAEWAGAVRERAERGAPPFDPGLLELGAHLLETLPVSAGRDNVVVHGDFNPGNILSATREPWLAIDPHPMVGDPAYDPSQLLLQVDSPFACPDPAAVLAHRFALFGGLIGEDPRRLLAWGVAREVEYAMWEWDRGQYENAAGAMDEVAILAQLAGL